MTRHFPYLIHYAIGYVFIISGMMKWMSPELQHSFLNLGLPFSQFTLFSIAIIEIACGLFILLRLYVKQACIPLIIIMIGAIMLTKLPLISQSIFTFAFEARLDLVMLMLLIVIWVKEVKHSQFFSG